MNEIKNESFEKKSKNKNSLIQSMILLKASQKN